MLTLATGPPAPAVRLKLEGKGEPAMMGGWNGWSWWGWVLMSLTMVGFWGLVIWGIVALFRRGGDSRPERPDPERILAERFASGEIDEEEYHRRLQTLRSTNGRPANLSGSP
jgi:putative membrane protein